MTRNQVLPFEEAREFARSLRLRRYRDWTELCKSGKKLYNVPSNPNTVYKNKGWSGIRD